MTVDDYTKVFRSLSGSSLQRVKTILAHYSERWGWDGCESIVSDLLDDETIHVEQVIVILEAAAKYECRSDDMENAIVAIRQCVQASGGYVVDVAEVFRDKRTRQVQDAEVVTV